MYLYSRVSVQIASPIQRDNGDWRKNIKQTTS